MRKLLLAIEAAAIVLFSSGWGHAQAPTPHQIFKDWRYECYAQKSTAAVPTTPNTPKPVCAIQHEVRTGDGLQLVARVRVMESTQQALLILVLPPTLRANSPIDYSIDQGQTATMHVRQCNPQWCWASVSMGDDLVRSLKAGNQLNIVLKQENADSKLAVSLHGFTSAYGALQRDKR